MMDEFTGHEVQNSELLALKFSLSMLTGNVSDNPEFAYLDELDTVEGNPTLELISGLWGLFMATFEQFIEETERDFTVDEALEISIATHPNWPSEDQFEALLDVIREIDNDDDSEGRKWPA